MLKYVATAAAAALLLGVALESRASRRDRDAAPDAEVGPPQARPEVVVEQGPDGRRLTVRHRMLGAVSRARLECEHDGRSEMLAHTTDCRRSLQREGEDGDATEVELEALLPEGVTEVRLVLEDETGTRVVPVALD